MTTQEAWEKQFERMEYYRKNKKELIIREKMRSEAEKFEEIGIFNVQLNKPFGYIRLRPEDFIVEEIAQGGKIFRVDNLEINKETINQAEGNTLFCNLIKISIPTGVAIERISNYFKIEQNKIGRSGLKDADAITSQQIAFNNSKISYEDIIKAKIPNIYLSDFNYGKGSLNAGDLEANKFILTVRTELPIDEKFKFKIANIKDFGVLNYFQTQRFGGLRLLSHKLGKLVMRGEYELAVKYFLFKKSLDDIPLIKNMRQQAEKNFPNWRKIKEIFADLPYTFFNEIRLLDYLVENPKNFIGGLINLEDQTQLWVYAYTSWLFNKYLSNYAKTKGCIDEKFPLLTNANPQDRKIYISYLKEDGTVDFEKNLRPFKFIRFKDRLIDGRIFPQEIAYQAFNGGVVISFIIPKGCYATTVLTNLFELKHGQPFPEWLNADIIDPLEITKQGNLKQLKEIFKDYWISKADLMEIND